MKSGDPKVWTGSNLVEEYARLHGPWQRKYAATARRPGPGIADYGSTLKYFRKTG
jgi:hypothetical protein